MTLDAFGRMIDNCGDVLCLWPECYVWFPAHKDRAYCAWHWYALIDVSRQVRDAWMDCPDWPDERTWCAVSDFFREDRTDRSRRRMKKLARRAHGILAIAGAAVGAAIGSLVGTAYELCMDVLDGEAAYRDWRALYEEIGGEA